MRRFCECRQPFTKMRNFLQGLVHVCESRTAISFVAAQRRGHTKKRDNENYGATEGCFPRFPDPHARGQHPSLPIWSHRTRADGRTEMLAHDTHGTGVIYTIQPTTFTAMPHRHHASAYKHLLFLRRFEREISPDTLQVSTTTASGSAPCSCIHTTL